MENKSIEDLFKDSFENYEAEVDSSVWENIKTGMKGIGLGFLGKAIINKIGSNTIVAIVSSVATVIGTVGVMHWTGNAVKNTDKPAVAQTEKTVAQPMTENKKEPVKTEATVAEAKTEISKPVATAETEEQKMQETKLAIQPFIKDKKQIQSVIKTFSADPIALIFASPTGGTVPLIVNLSNSGKGNTYRWKYSDGKKDDRVANPIHVFENPGVYWVTLTSTDAEGKTATDSAKIVVTGNSSLYEVPRELTPNGDSLNDVFYFKGSNIVKMTGQIADEKGKTIFECNKVGAYWDGKDQNGKEAKAGLYYYLMSAEGKDGKTYEKKGRISLIR